MDKNDFFLTELYFEVSRLRIKQIEEKALRRLSMTEEELKTRRSLTKIMNDPAFRNFLTTLLIVGAFEKSESLDRNQGNAVSNENRNKAVNNIHRNPGQYLSQDQ